MSLIGTKNENNQHFTSMSSWLSGGERGLQSERAQVQITVGSERERGSVEKGGV